MSLIETSTMDPGQVQIGNVVNWLTVADEPAMLALPLGTGAGTVQQGDEVWRTDTSTVWKLEGADPAILANWNEDTQSTIVADLAAHKANVANPHTVTRQQTFDAGAGVTLAKGMYQGAAGKAKPDLTGLPFGAVVDSLLQFGYGTDLALIQGSVVVTEGTYSVIKNGGGAGVDQIDFATDLIAAKVALAGTTTTAQSALIFVKDDNSGNVYPIAAITGGGNNIATLGNLGFGTAISNATTAVAVIINPSHYDDLGTGGAADLSLSLPQKVDPASGATRTAANDGGSLLLVDEVKNEPTGTLASCVQFLQQLNTGLVNIPSQLLKQLGDGAHKRLIPKSALSTTPQDGDEEHITSLGRWITDSIGRFRVSRSYPNWIAKAASYTALATEQDGYSGAHYSIDSTAGAVTLTLPAANAKPAGQMLVTITDALEQAGTNNITLAGAGADTVSLAATQVLTAPGESITVVNDGVANWEVI